MTTIKNYIEKRERELRDLPSDEGGLALERMHPTDEDRLHDFHRQSLEGLVALLRGEIKKMEKNVPTEKEYREMDLSEMGEVRCNLAFNSALKDFSSLLSDSSQE